MKLHYTALLLTTALTLSACQASPGDAENPATEAIHAVRKGINEAQKSMNEVKELAQAQGELASKNLSLNNSKDRKDLPKAEITPQGELLIQDKAVPATPEQRQLILDYRMELLGIISDSIAIGVEGSKVGMDAAGAVLKALVSQTPDEKMSKEIKDSARARLQPHLDKLCARLPRLYASQQALAEMVPQFRPYATMDQADSQNCQDSNDWTFQ